MRDTLSRSTWTYFVYVYDTCVQIAHTTYCK